MDNTTAVNIIIAHLKSLDPARVKRVTDLIAEAMHHVNKVAPELTGAQKKQLVIDAVSAIPADSFTKELIEAVRTIVSTNILPDFIETAMDISRGNFDFKLLSKDVQDVKKVGGACMPLVTFLKRQCGGKS